MKKYYFAYGLSLEESHMVDLYPTARFYKFGSLRGFRLIFSGVGICSLKNGSINDMIEGVVYELEEEIKPPLEGSILSSLDVMTHDGKYVLASVFITKDKNLVPPQEEYVMRIHKKYQDYGFNMKPLEDALDKSTY